MLERSSGWNQRVSRNCPTHALAYEPVNASMDEKGEASSPKLV